MTLSRILMGLLLAVLAYMVYVIMSCGDKNEAPTPTTTVVPSGTAGASMAPPMAPAPTAVVAPTTPEATTVAPAATTTAPAGFSNIVYEKFANVGGLADSLHGAAPFKNNTVEDDNQFATVKYTGLVDANPEDVLQIEGTDLLTAPLVDNLLYTNSIANTNRNASQDLRGDLPLQFNETYTPFYSSVIYGAPLSEKTMTIS